MSFIPSPDYRALNRLFGEHIPSFGTVDNRVKTRFDLKIRHTNEVVGNIEEIACQEGMDEHTVQLARAIALLHDLDRKGYATRILSKIPASPELLEITRIINPYMIQRSL